MTLEGAIYGRGGEFIFPQNERRLASFSCLAVGTNAGNGHNGQAGLITDALNQLGIPTFFRDFTAMVSQYATSEEKKVLDAREWFTRVGLTQYLASKLSWASYDVFNAIATKYPAQTQMRDIEGKLTGLFAKVITASHFDGLIATHPGLARMALEAKSLGHLPKEFPLFSVACDHLAKASNLPVVREIYNYSLGKNQDAGSHNYVLVASDEVAEQFIRGGYPPEVIKVVGNHSELSSEESQIIAKKQQFLERVFRSQRILKGYPGIFSFPEDNFETIPERLAVQSMIAGYSKELSERQLIFAILMTERDEEKVRRSIHKSGIANDRVMTVHDIENLEEFLSQPERFSQSIVFARKYSDRKAHITHEDHVQFTQMQRLLELYSLAVFSRPSEVPRDSANFATPSFLIFPYGPVEVNIGKEVQEHGFALPWATVDRSLSSSLHCARLGLPRLDLTDPYTYKELLTMSNRALESPMRQPLTGIVHSIYDIVQNQILTLH